MANSLLGCLSVLFLFSQAFATTEDPHDPHAGEAFIFYIENDSRSLGGPGSDQAYSNGFKFSYIYAQDRIPVWAKSSVHNLQFLDKLDKSKVNFGLSLAQQIYTPDDTSSSSLVTDDRPYAGWLYLGFAVSFQKEFVGHFLELDVGMVGPSALGKQVQNNYHDMIAFPHAEGWSNGLHDEPTLQLSYQKRFKYFKSEYLDFFPYYGIGLGNVLVGGHIGSLLRFGVHLPNDFGPSRPSASEGDSFVAPTSNPDFTQNSYYIFGGARGNFTARNIFLDGNNFQPSHHVKRYPLTFETEFGAGLQIMPFALVWRFVTRSPEFEQRNQFNSFACLNIIYFF